MYKNLIKQLEDRHISVSTLAKILEIDEKSVRNKLSGTTEFKLSEINTIMKLFPEYNMSWLFASEEEVAS